MEILSYSSHDDEAAVTVRHWETPLWSQSIVLSGVMGDGCGGSAVITCVLSDVTSLTLTFLRSSSYMLRTERSVSGTRPLQFLVEISVWGTIYWR